MGKTPCGDAVGLEVWDGQPAYLRQGDRLIRRILWSAGICWVSIALASDPVQAQATRSDARGGFYVGLSLARGWLDAPDVNVDYGSSLAGAIRFGGSIQDRWLVGLESNAWVDGVDEDWLVQGNVLLTTHFYPRVEGGWFVKGGIGRARLEQEIGTTLDKQSNGWSAVLGVGYDVYLRAGFSLEPYFDVMRGAYDGSGTTTIHLGVGLVRH